MSDTDIFAAGAKRFAAEGLRENNVRAVLMAVTLHPGSSGAQLARVTGLGPQSVSRILVDLEEAGLVYRGNVVRGQRGKPATPIFLNPKGAYAIGCEIGWRHYNIVLRDIGGAVLGEHRRDYAYPDANVVPGEVISVARLLLGSLPETERSRVVGFGLAMPSSIARNLDLVGGSPEAAAAWTSVDLPGAIEAALGLETFVFNDGNAGCWEELVLHPTPRPHDFAYLFVGTFIGAGVVAEGRLWRGSTGNSANLGSMVVTDDNGQKQVAHLIASIYALEGRLRAAGLDVPEGDPARWDWDQLEPVAGEWIETAGRALATVIANTTAVSELNTVIIDGAMPRPVLVRLMARIQHYLDRLPTLTYDHPQLRQGQAGGAAAAGGAALQPIYLRLFSRDFDDIMRNF